MKKSLSAGALAIVNAIIWASLMIAAATIAEADAYGALNPLLVAGWFMTHMLLDGAAISSKAAGAEWRCIQRGFRRLRGRG
ncbi:MAG: hypothetical protein AAGE01_21855 [Pseudomonadota bacterium]